MGADKLVAMVQAMQHSALGYQTDTLSVDRQDALNHYFGRPYGNEVDGRSKIVERTLMEVVEWTMPQIMRAITTADEIAKFKPRNAKDVPQAQQESDYVNYIIMERNDGFMVLHDAIKDALLLKNGYIKRYWEKYRDTHIESYSGLDEDEITQLMAELEEEHDEVEVLGKTEREIEILPPFPMPQAQPGQPPQPIKKTVYDLKMRLTSEKGRVCVEAVPAEEVLVSPRCRGNLQKSDFVGHVPQNLTRRDLIDMGMDEDFVMTLPAKGIARTKPEEIARDTLDQNAVSTYSPNNPIMDIIDYLEAYVLVDFDGDGKVERRRVVLAGNRLPPGSQWNEEVDEVPFSYGTPTRMPHRHVGLSLDDFVDDIQKIRTTLVRQTLDNVYITNNQRPVINEAVTLGDVQLSAPGAPIRIKGRDPVQGALQYAQPTPIIGQIMPVLEYFEDRKEQRTGIGRSNTIIDSDVIRDSANETVQMAFNSANQRIEMMIRMFAETMLKDLVRGVHSLVIKHQNEPEMVQLRGNWVEVDPREWRDRYEMSVTVGLGIGTQQEQRANLMFIASVQERAAQAGIVSPQNGYNLASDIAKRTGFKEHDRYFTDPSSPAGQRLAQQRAQAQQAQTQMPLQIEQARAQGAMAQANAKVQAQNQQTQIKAALERAQSVLDHQLAAAQITAEQRAEAQKLLLQQKAEADKLQLDHNNNQSEIILNFIAKIVGAALMAKAQPQQIPADVAAVRGTLNG